MNLTDTQKEELRKLVEEDGCNIYAEEMKAKEDFTELAKSIKETFGIEPKDFKKMVKLYFKSSADEEMAKNDAFYKLYKEVVG